MSPTDSLRCQSLSAFAFLLCVSASFGILFAQEDSSGRADGPLTVAEGIDHACNAVALAPLVDEFESHEGNFASVSEQDSFSEIPLKAVFDDGFRLKSKDDQFQLRIRTLLQLDGKVFAPSDQEPARSGLYIPRFRVYFEGQLTDLFEYELSLQRSVEGTFDILDANINFVRDEEFQVRLGRALVPYSYAWYDHLEQYYITPERGLFALNFGLARQAGLFAHGKVFNQQLQYAIGAAFGQLSGLADTNTTRDAVGYLNAKPYLHSEQFSWLRFLNIGGSLAVGQQAYEAAPLPLRTSIQTSENDEAAQGASSIFLEYTTGSVAKGERLQGALHAALYSGPFSIEAECYAARFGLAPNSASSSVGIPILGYDVTLASFLTGETVEDRKTVTPLRPMTKDGPGRGAVEVFGRYSNLKIGSEVFSSGLANPNDWTNSAGIMDVGVNWYLTHFVRVTLDWQHSMYATPVLLNEQKDLRSKHNDLFWVRCQLYF
ncbi:OprO/OprP family phosphate-selective porin [Schlesneria paludicola]|uniref:OprO/OprP family phosphate-selective porin n=1 Tax=Schlesneria paludicola TaxID=360056 RepID=UPI00029A8F64|nr:porin [Schlesneria paludicola]